MSIIPVLLIAFSLSMDAFSLSLAYGTLKMSKSNKIILSIIVGLFHFFMPLLGDIVGYTVINVLPIKPHYILFIILFFIGFEMIIESFKDNNSIKYLDLLGMILFGFAVSLDSFTTGLGLNVIYNNKYISIIFFSIFSATFTYIGLNLGEYISCKIGKISTFIGGLILIFIGVFYII